MAAYAELHCLSNFSFLRGASHPQELVARAAELGYAALALTDECSVAGVVRAHVATKDRGLKLIIGSELQLADGPRLVLLAVNRQGYANLCGLITRGRRAAAKGSYRLTRSDVVEFADDLLALLLPEEEPALEPARWLAGCFPGRAWIAAELTCGADDDLKLATLAALGEATGLPLAAAGDVHMHRPARRALQDTLTAIRLRTPLAAAGHALHPNGQRHLRSRQRLETLYPPALLAATLDIAGRCHFSLDELRYEYPEELVPPGESAGGYLRKLTEAGMQQRWPRGIPDRVRQLRIFHSTVPP